MEKCVRRKCNDAYKKSLAMFGVNSLSLANMLKYRWVEKCTYEYNSKALIL
jgi:hypothetical protein